MVSRGRHAGFSLVETMCALAVLGVLALGLVGGGRDHARSISNAFEETIALRVAQSAMELTIGQSANTLAHGTHRLPIDARDRRRVSTLEGVLHVEPHDDGLLKLRIEVRWRPRGSPRSRRIELTTLRALEEMPR